MREPLALADQAKSYEEIVLFYESLNLPAEEITHYQIERLYDIAQLMLQAIEYHGIENAARQLEIAQPAIEQIAETADALSLVLIQYLKEGTKENPPLSKEVDTSVRRFFVAMDTLNDAFKTISGIED